MDLFKQSHAWLSQISPMNHELFCAGMAWNPTKFCRLSGLFIVKQVSYWLFVLTCIPSLVLWSSLYLRIHLFPLFFRSPNVRPLLYYTNLTVPSSMYVSYIKFQQQPHRLRKTAWPPVLTLWTHVLSGFLCLHSPQNNSWVLFTSL